MIIFLFPLLHQMGCILGKFPIYWIPFHYEKNASWLLNNEGSGRRGIRSGVEGMLKSQIIFNVSEIIRDKFQWVVSNV